MNNKISKYQLASLGVLIAITLLLGFSSAQDIVIPAGPLGDIRGTKERTSGGGTGREYNQFLGIPYAKGPLASGRFLPAEPIDTPLVPPGSVFDARFEGNSCVQPSGFSLFDRSTRNLSLEYVAGNNEAFKYYEKKLKISKGIGIKAHLGEEDCLNLNIYTPKLPSDGGPLIPVVVFIHGGAFSSGNGVFYNPSKLLEHDVILVTINYRLGILGFFCLETNEAPGNAALYDMVEALKWVQSYIQHFGGDPNRVTVAGQSAGAAGVTHLMLSEMSVNPRPLFHRAIALSGSVLNDWATTLDPKPASLRIATLSTCYDPLHDNTEEGEPDVAKIMNCMKQVNPDNLVEALNVYQREERQFGRLGFDAVSPVVQKATFEPKFLRFTPEEILESGLQVNVPLMQGATKDDGTFPLGVLYNRYLNCAECGEKHKDPEFLRNELIPKILQSMGVEDKTHAVYNALQYKFFEDVEQSGNFEAMIPGLSELNSVFFFKAGAYRNLALHSRLNENSFWYSFDYKGQYSLFALFFPFPPPPIPGGVAHSDDLLYLFHFFTLNSPDSNVSLQFVNYWINFIYNGNPNIPVKSTVKATKKALFWPAFKESTKNYMIMDSTFRIGSDYMKSWSSGTCASPSPSSVAENTV